jgi:hypothetical protein
MKLNSILVPLSLVVAATGTTLVVLAACSSSSTSNITDTGGGEGGAGEGGGGSGITATQAATDVATALCQRYQACAPAFIQLGFGTVDLCTSREANTIAKVIGANGSTVTPDQFEACAKAIPGASCADVLGRNLPAVCKYAGTLADGMPCADDAQCMNERCKVATYQTCGTCTSPAAAGAVCAVDDDCKNGMKCVNTACVAYGAMGDTCDDTHPCNATLGCVSGKCAMPLGPGSDCSGTSKQGCDQLNGAFCDPFNNKCVTLQYADPSATCGFSNDAGTITLCKGPGSDCANITAPTFQGTCAAAAADGTSCAIDGGPTCEGPAVCQSGMCVVPDPSKCM